MAVHLILEFAGCQVSAGLGKYGANRANQVSQGKINQSKSNQIQHISPLSSVIFCQFNPDQANQSNGAILFMIYIPELLIIISLQV